MEHKFTVLIIDDEPDNFEVIETLLDGENYQLNYISSAERALALLENFLPDVILLDVMMPRMNGIEFCRQFKANAQWKHIPVIMVTALTDKTDLSRCLMAGADDFISKPVDRLELRSRVRSMLRIKQQQDVLKETLSLRENLSNMMVHDLRTPLTSILLAAGILQKTDYSPEKQQRITQQIFIAGQQLESMIDSLLLMAKLESGKMLLNLEECDFCNVCRMALSDYEAIATQKQLELISDFPTAGIYGLVDPILLRRVLGNLLSNAIKFSPSKSQVTLNAWHSENGMINLQVIDSGAGIPEHLKQTIFDKYEIGDRMKNTAQIGLGLAFCKLAIEAHGGTISVRDNAQKGSVFTISLSDRQLAHHNTILNRIG